MIIDPSFAKTIALKLLNINAVILQPNEPFTWSSGWNSPIYCDNRLTMRYPKIRKNIARTFIDFVNDEYGGVDVVTGTATAGIPHAAWVAGSMNKPMAYVRSKAKSYGMGNQIEGGVHQGVTIIVVEDMISTGGSAISVLEAFKLIDEEVQEVLSIFTFGIEKANQPFEQADLPLYPHTDYKT